jgi:hypothetical protein
MTVLAGCASDGAGKGDDLAAVQDSRAGDMRAAPVLQGGSGGSTASGAMQSAGPAATGSGGSSMAFGSPLGQSPGTSGGLPVSTDGEAPLDPGASNESEKYTDVGVNPFVVVEHGPFSTFAADVDTASYDLFRRDVNLGLVPQPASVRVEDYVNNFAYDPGSARSSTSRAERSRSSTARGGSRPRRRAGTAS